MTEVQVIPAEKYFPEGEISGVYRASIKEPNDLVVHWMRIFGQINLYFAMIPWSWMLPEPQVRKSGEYAVIKGDWVYVEPPVELVQLLTAANYNNGHYSAEKRFQETFLYLTKSTTVPEAPVGNEQQLVKEAFAEKLGNLIKGECEAYALSVKRWCNEHTANIDWKEVAQAATDEGAEAEWLDLDGLDKIQHEMMDLDREARSRLSSRRIDYAIHLIGSEEHLPGAVKEEAVAFLEAKRPDMGGKDFIAIHLILPITEYRNETVRVVEWRGGKFTVEVSKPEMRGWIKTYQRDNLGDTLGIALNLHPFDENRGVAVWDNKE